MCYYYRGFSFLVCLVLAFHIVVLATLSMEPELMTSIQLNEREDMVPVEAREYPDWQSWLDDTSGPMINAGEFYARFIIGWCDLSAMAKLDRKFAAIRDYPLYLSLYVSHKINAFVPSARLRCKLHCLSRLGHMTVHTVEDFKVPGAKRLPKRTSLVVYPSDVDLSSFSYYK